MQNRSIDDYRHENKIETFFTNNQRFTNCGIMENKEDELHGS